MKNYARSTPTIRHREPGGGFDDDDEIVIHLPDPTLLRIIARSVLLAAAILSFPWLRLVLLQSSAAAASAESKWVDDPFSLPMLVGDLKRQGFLACGAKALFLGDPRSRLAFLRKKRIDPVTERARPAVGDRSVDLLLAADGLADSDPSFGFVDRVVKVGGVVVVRLGSEDEAGYFRLPSNYRLAYIRRFGATFVGLKKMFHANAGGGSEDEDGTTTTTKQRLLSDARSKSKAPEGLEDALSEPPKWEEAQSNKPKYLPGLMGDNLLVACQKRVFTGVKKMFHTNAGESEDVVTTTERQLLSVAGSKSEAPEGLEDAVSEPPEWEEVQSNKPKYLPGLMGDNLLVACQKRVFTGVKKMFHANAGESEDDGTTTKRRLLSVAGSKSEAPEGLEDVSSEPPEWEEVQSNNPKHLSGLMGESSMLMQVNWKKRVFAGAKKIFHSSNAGGSEGGTTAERRLLSVARSKSEALEGLEDAFLEPPEWEEINVHKPKYLPDLMGDDSLVAYPKRVFVDVGEEGRTGGSEWFGREYPKKGAEFEIVRVDLVGGGGGGIAEWLRKNVREEEFVVMKAEAEVAEEMVREKVIGLVDELFLECDDQKRAYWECLAIYGRVRAEGVAVHQWWK